jgi:ADP-ribose pyrophosphatase YjhB (NUDIX family)
MERSALVRAAGGIVWKRGAGGWRLALIHRPRRGDWTLPKGKLESGETFEEAALREVAEETGCEARLGPFAGASSYTSRRGPKVVLYWHMTLVREGTETAQEVDEVRWLTPTQARRKLDRERDRRLLRGALAAARCLATPAARAGHRPARDANAV